MSRLSSKLFLSAQFTFCDRMLRTILLRTILSCTIFGYPHLLQEAFYSSVGLPAEERRDVEKVLLHPRRHQTVGGHGRRRLGQRIGGPFPLGP